MGDKIKMVGEFMRRGYSGFSRLWLSGILLLMSSAALAAGEKPATKLINVADTRSLAGGLTKWVADIYNSNYWLYGAIVVLIMAGMGLVLGFGFDRLISLLGIDLGKLDHHE